MEKILTIYIYIYMCVCVCARVCKNFFTFIYHFTHKWRYIFHIDLIYFISNFRYSWSMKNDALSFHIYDKAHLLNSWWGPPWMWKEEAQSLCALEYLRIFHISYWSQVHYIMCVFKSCIFVYVNFVPPLNQILAPSLITWAH